MLCMCLYNFYISTDLHPISKTMPKSMRAKELQVAVDVVPLVDVLFSSCQYAMLRQSSGQCRLLEQYKMHLAASGEHIC